MPTTSIPKPRHASHDPSATSELPSTTNPLLIGWDQPQPIMNLPY